MNDLSPATVARHACVSARELKAWLNDGGEIALLDVREHGQYGESHLFFAVPLPYSRLEADARRLVPRRATRIVVYDDGMGSVAARAARRLAGLGYSRVFVLEGGTQGWAEAGFQLFAGVNVPSKTFGELAEHTFGTPRISARELSERLARGDNVVVLDGRPVDEYRKMSIPSAICCPNGELALRAERLVSDAQTTIVINCAGRTRSIIGAQNLIDMGIANPVRALENGTQGWYLEDLALDRGADRLYPPPSEAALPRLRRQARAFADAWRVPFVSTAEMEGFRADTGFTTYLCDVRTPEEFSAGTLPGAQSTPGGQLVQATDQYVAARKARLVVFDGEGVRAPVIAARLRQMGWDALVLEEGISAPLAPEPETEPLALPDLPPVPAQDMADLMGTATVLDMRPSMTYRALHLKGAAWTIRPRLDNLAIPSDRPVVLVTESAVVAQLAALDLAERGIRDVRAHLADTEAWLTEGLATEATPGLPPDGDCIDFLFFVHDRHSGNKAAARQYLAWETNLLSQIDADERASFRI